MSAGRIHVGAGRGKAAVSVIAKWDDGTAIADIEEAVKQAARDAIRAARERTQSHQ